MSEESPSYGQTVYSYDLRMVRILEQCVRANPVSVADALKMFLSTSDLKPGTGELIDVWLRFAERFANGSTYEDEVGNHEGAIMQMKIA